MELTQKRLKERVNYNPDTGIFTWKARLLNEFKSEINMNKFNSQLLDNPVGTKKNDGYLILLIDGKSYRLHRLAWLYVYGVMPDSDIDHINSVRDDNRICNLRQATRSENMQNLKKAMINNKSSGLLGVSYDKKLQKFYSRIGIKGKRKYLGFFKTPEEAHAAYLNAKRELHLFSTL